MDNTIWKIEESASLSTDKVGGTNKADPLFKTLLIEEWVDGRFVTIPIGVEALQKALLMKGKTVTKACFNLDNNDGRTNRVSIDWHYESIIVEILWHWWVAEEKEFTLWENKGREGTNVPPHLNLGSLLRKQIREKK